MTLVELYEWLTAQQARPQATGQGDIRALSKKMGWADAQ